MAKEKDPVPDAVRDYFKKLTSKAGKASAKALTPEERKKKASKAAKARWSKTKKK
jgi:hypothetical protein